MKSMQIVWIFLITVISAIADENISSSTHITNEKIRYCVDPDWMPLEGIERRKVTGMVSDLVDLFSRKTGYPFLLVPTKNWEETLDYLQEGKCDILPMIMESQSRNNHFYFTDPYLQFPIMIVTTYDKSFIPDLQSISGEVVGVKRNYVYKELLEPLYPNIQFVEYDSVEKGLRDVNRGKLFGFIGNLYSIGYQIHQNFATQLKISGKLDETLLLSIGVSKNRPELYPVMQKMVESLVPEEIDAMTSRWLTITYHTEVKDYTFLWRVLAGVFIVGLFLLYRQYILSKYNQQLQEEVIRKVEELRKKDEILVQKLRMAAMGEMLSMIAHQWRQPLSAINSTLMSIDLRLKLKRYDFSKEDERNAFLSFLEERHKRVGDYTKFLSHTIDDFRHFFSPNKEKRLCPITEPLTRAYTLMGDILVSRGVGVKRELCTDVSVMMFENEVTQVILNILQNSEDNFKISEHKSPEINIKVYADEESAFIEICDNGGGIPEAIMAKIFEPYFSTKEEQNGVGLGLYMSKEIIEKHHGGSLKVENRGEGVCFTIRLPRK